MSMVDPISDLLTRIRNGHRARMGAVTVPAAKIKVAVLNILRDEGYIRDFSVVKGRGQIAGEIDVQLKYAPDRTPAITGLRRHSTPGSRAYRKAKDIPSVRKGLGVSIVSTSKGVMTDKRARKEGVGGELLCSVW